jgi:hypothetical protein
MVEALGLKQHVPQIEPIQNLQGSSRNFVGVLRQANHLELFGESQAAHRIISGVRKPQFDHCHPRPRTISRELVNRLCLLACLVVLSFTTSCSYLKGKPPEPVFRFVVKELPTPGSTVMVWVRAQESSYVGPADGKVEQEAAAWLREHGLNVVRWSQEDRVFSPQEQSPGSADATAVLKLAKLTGAKQVLLLQAYSDRVTVRAVDTETGRMAWSGTGQYVDAVAEFDARERATSLTRRTLDAIWKAKL